MIHLQNIRVGFYPVADGGWAVDGVSLTMAPGSILAIVGESGSGKSSLGLALGGLIPRGEALVSGRVVLPDGEIDLADYTVRPEIFGYIFQEPAVCLHPAMRVGRQIEEAWWTGRGQAPAAEELAVLLERVGLGEPARLCRCFAHELSGGMQQRVMIAMALAQKPTIIVADEPTTALDPINQLRVLETLCQVAAADRLGLILITHDFGIVSRFASHVAVLECGRLVESGATAEVLRYPAHTATRRLIAAVPRKRDGMIQVGEPLEGVGV